MPTIKRSLSCPTAKSKSFDFSLDKATIPECFSSTLTPEKTFCALKLKDEELQGLRQELSVQENKNQELFQQLQQEQIKYNDLASNFSKITEENDVNVQRAMWLETENARLVARVEELQSLQREAKGDTSRRILAFTEKIAAQNSIIERMDRSKTKLEREVARLLTANNKYRDFEDKDQNLQSKLKSLQLSRNDLEKEAKKAHQLSLGNQELEKQVAHGAERLFVAERRISELLIESEALEQQNLTLREEKANLLQCLQLAGEGKIVPKPVHGAIAGKLFVETSNAEATLAPVATCLTVSPYCLEKMVDESRSGSDVPSKGWVSLASISEAQTPSLYNWKETPKNSRNTSLASEYFWKESPQSAVSGPGYARKADVLEEYLHLSASAVKINFPTVEISNDELLREARKMPYHKLYDFLYAKMELKLQEQELERSKTMSDIPKKSKLGRFFSWSSPIKKKIDLMIESKFHNKHGEERILQEN